MKLVIRVPATSANLGPGFDCLGLALDWWNTIEVEPIARGLQIEYDCAAAGDLPRDKRNLIVYGMRRVFRAAHEKLPPLKIRATCDIPIGSGLGSSSSAIVGGLVAANTWLGEKFSLDELVTLATQIEGHPDNVAPALLGGLVIAAQEGKRVIAARFDVPPELRAVVFVPNVALLTKHSRGVLPARIPRADAIYNTSRAALWIAAITQRRWDWLTVATHDRLHQPYRAKLVRGMSAMLAAAQKAGACGAALSGAGPSIIAFTDGAGAPIAQAFTQVAKRMRVSGAAHIVEISARGAQVEFFKI